MNASPLAGVAPHDVRDISVYRLSPGRRLVSYLLLVFGVSIMIATVWLPLSTPSPGVAGSYSWFVLIGFFILDLGIYFFLAALRIRLITSPWGIEYYNIGISVRAPWRSVVGLEQVRQGYQQIDSLMLNRQAQLSGLMSFSLEVWPVVKPLIWITAILSGYWWRLLIDMDTDKIRRSIPIALFDANWRSSSLGDDINRYAPQLFGQEQEQEAGNEPPARDQGTPATRTGAIAVVAIVGLAQLLLAFFVAPSVYRSAQPLLGATDPLPGQLFLKEAYGPADLSQDGRLLAAGGQVVSVPDGTTRFSVRLPTRPDGTSNLMESVALSADGALVAAGDDSGDALVWRVTDGHLMRTFSVTHPIMVNDSLLGPTTIAYVYSISFSPDAKNLATIGPSGQVKVWNVGDGSVLSSMQSSDTALGLGSSAQLLFDPTGHTLLSLVEGKLSMWRVEDGSLAGKVDPGDWVTSMALSADGRTLALGTLHGGIYLWDVRSGAVSRTIKEQSRDGSTAEYMYAAAISPDGKTVVSGSALGGMQVWSADGGNPRNMRDSNDTTVRWMTLSSDGSKLVYSNDKDSSIWVWAVGAASFP